MRRQLLRHSLRLFLLGVMALPARAAPAALPEPATGGKNGGPIDLLIYRGHCEMNFGNQPPLDPTYLQKLRDRGYRVTVLGEDDSTREKDAPFVPAGEWRPLTLDYLRQFNAVLYPSPSPMFGGGYFDHTNWRSGQHMLTIRKNAELLRRYVEEGGGLLIVPSMEELCMRTTESLKLLLKPYGLTTECAGLRDETHSFVPEKIINVFPVLYSWTTRIARHPAAEGVERVWYPAYATRWDDNYTTIPLFPLDDAWRPVVSPMPEADSYWLRGSIYDPTAEWYKAENLPGAPHIMMARDFGAGRMAVLGICAYHVYYLTYSKTGNFAEANFAVVDGIAMEHGNTKRDPYQPKTRKGRRPEPVAQLEPEDRFPSDLHVLLDNTYRWLAEPSLAGGWGGYSDDGPQPGEPLDIERGQVLADVWAEQDPLMRDGQVRPMRILIGARSAASSGNGTPGEWAAAAKAAGYDVICFTEALEDVDIPRWLEFVEACEAASDGDVHLLPGLDILTDLNDRILAVGHTAPIRTHILREDQTCFWTGVMLLGMGDVLPIVSRPEHHAQSRPGVGALSPGVYTAIPGIAVATYKDGKQIDDGFFAWRYQADNASQPIPTVVHEVDDPADLAAAARTGMQSYVNADTPAHAAFFFRQGHASFGGNPMRYFISSGPAIGRCTIDDWSSQSWTIRLRADSDAAITEIVARDQYGAYRRLTPNAKDIDVRFSGDLGVQRWFMIELTDAAGGKAYASQIRTLPKAATIRCMDRQNWFSPLSWEDLSYTCKTVTGGGAVRVPGVELAAPFCNKLNIVWSGPGFYMHDNMYESTWVPGGNRFRGDSSPLWHDLPIPEYAGRLRFVTVLRPTGRPGPLGGDAVRLYQADITLRQALEPQGDVWPIVASAAAGHKGRGADEPGIPYVMTRPDGRELSGTIPPEGFVDLPPGGVAGRVMAVSPLRVDGSGNVGFPAPDGQAPAGTRFHGEWVTIAPDHAADYRRLHGFSGERPFAIALTRGELAGPDWYLAFTAEDGGVAGKVAGAEDLPKLAAGMPLKLLGANPRWPLGLWDGSNDSIVTFAFFEGHGLGQMDLRRDRTFYFGNLLLADRPELHLAFASDWTAEGATVEVSNPTDRPITSIVRTPEAIPNRKPLRGEVTVPAGSTVYAEL